MKTALLIALSLVGTAGAQGTVEERLSALEKRVGGAGGSKTALSAFNPSVGVALDAVLRQSDARGSFRFRAAELNLGADIDPFVKGWVILNANAAEVALEEAAVKTTALPYNLTLTAGRQFASFGRLARFHDHELPVVERPRSLDTFVGGETQADGVEVSYLVPTPFYLTATAGAFNKIGGDNTRVANATDRTLDEFTYLGRLATSVEPGDDHGVDLSLHSAWTPKRTMQEDLTVTGVVPPATHRSNTWRTLHGAELTYRYHPASAGGYNGFLWSTEVMQNNERRFGAGNVPVGRVNAWGGLTYVQARLGKRWRPGALLDLAADLDNKKALTRTWTAFAAYDVSEFNKLRVAYSWVNDTDPKTRNDNVIALQWTLIMGYHVHGFRDR